MLLELLTIPFLVGLQPLLHEPPSLVYFHLLEVGYLGELLWGVGGGGFGRGGFLEKLEVSLLEAGYLLVLQGESLGEELVRGSVGEVVAGDGEQHLAGLWAVGVCALSSHFVRMCVCGRVWLLFVKELLLLFVLKKETLLLYKQKVHN